MNNYLDQILFLLQTSPETRKSSKPLDVLGHDLLFNTMGNTALQIGDYNEALKCYSVAIKSTLELIDRTNSLNNKYYLKEELSNVKDIAFVLHYDKAGLFLLDQLKNLVYEIYHEENNIEAKIEYSKILSELALRLMKAGESARALETFESCVSVEKDLNERLKSFNSCLYYLEAELNLGNYYIQLREYNKAADIFKRIISYDENFINSYQDKIRLLRNLSRAYTGLGLCYEQKQELEKSLESLSKAAEYETTILKLVNREDYIIRSRRGIIHTNHYNNTKYKFENRILDAKKFAKRGNLKQALIEYREALDLVYSLKPFK